MSKRKAKRVKKALTSVQNIPQSERHIESPLVGINQGRGAKIYSLSNMLNISGIDQTGKYQSVPSDNPYFILSPQERNQIFQLSSPVLGIVSSRMNRVSGLSFEVTADNTKEDELVDKMQNMYDVVKEWEGLTELEYMVASAKIKQQLRKYLPTLRPDLANFQKALLRWKNGVRQAKQKSADEIKEWILRPNSLQSWNDFVKIWVYDLMVHGASAIYKTIIDGKLNNIQHLAGGSTMPIRTPFTTALEAYVQMYDYRYQIFYENELAFSQYLPVSWRSYGMIPLESLVNKVAETMMFDRLMAEQADGTKPPEKMVVVTDNKVFGNDMDLEIPIEGAEQKRVEEKLNRPIKNGIITFNGNHVEVVDITKENTMEFQNTRQKDIREEVALVFNMSNMEVNLTGSGDTSGRATSESQKEIEQGKGIVPILRTIEQQMNDEILPFYAGPNYTFKFSVDDSELATIELLTKKKQSGLYSTNELRIEDMNKKPFDGEEYDKPEGKGANNQLNPFFMQEVE